MLKLKDRKSNLSSVNLNVELIKRINESGLRIEEIIGLGLDKYEGKEKIQMASETAYKIANLELYLEKAYLKIDKLESDNRRLHRELIQK